MTTNVVKPLAPLAASDVDSDTFANAPHWARAKAMNRSGIWYWYQNVPTWYDSVGAWAAPGRVATVDNAPRGDGETAQFSLVVKG